MNDAIQGLRCRQAYAWPGLRISVDFRGTPTRGNALQRGRMMRMLLNTRAQDWVHGEACMVPMGETSMGPHEALQGLDQALGPPLPIHCDEAKALQGLGRPGWSV